MDDDHDSGASRERSRLRECIQQVFAGGDLRLDRLSRAATSVCFCVLDDPSQSVTVLLDRNPPSVVSGEEPAEITIELGGADADALARGALVLPPALHTGRIAYRGPVRKYLMVDPVLRSLLAALDVDDEALPDETIRRPSAPGPTEAPEPGHSSPLP